MRLSVALSTHNGSRHLAEQLQSLARQSRLPDELVACDDASSDDSRRILTDFAATAPFPVRLMENPANLGVTASFQNAIAACQGDVIALCDQDDIWQPLKLHQIETTLNGSPQVGLVFSDAQIVDEQLRPLGYNLWQSVGLTGRELRLFAQGRAMNVLLRRNVVSGATMAFRAAFRDMILPIPSVWIHDAWIVALIAAAARCTAISEPLIQYRQHAAQVFGAPRGSLWQQFQIARRMDRDYFVRAAEGWAAVRDRLRLFASRVTDPCTLDLLDEKVEHCRHRAQMREHGRLALPLILGELRRRRYRRYGFGWKSVAQDLFLR